MQPNTECTCNVQDMQFGRCCKSKPNTIGNDTCIEAVTLNQAVLTEGQYENLARKIQQTLKEPS